VSRAGACTSRAARALLPLLLAALACAPCAASAQRERDRARRLFETAVEQLHAGRFAEARDLLNQSLAIAPNPGTAFNLVVAYRGTGELLRAESLLDGLLRGEHGPLAGEQRREVDRMLAATRADIGTLAIEASGADEIELRIDGSVAGRSRDGASLEVRVDPGERVLVASAVDRETVERRIRVARGSRVAVSVALHPTPEALVGTLVLEAADPSHDVEIVGVARAPGRLARALPPGEYQVRLRSAAGVRESAVTVEARSRTRLRLEEARGGSVLEEPAFWLTGAGVLVAAAIGIAVAVAIGPPREAPVQDPEFGVVIALWAGP
jgi:hypothetical protein